ncbi:uncharacterized protein LOC110452420 [Mizuhopecten yessoensis]|uniref:uncharacterized protein LOC110452420 n=1 Tax=Mizuhopecten yessoensis TaxID=6573 RepID=UPI000B45BCC8|nr:uncharacterized protein LOC110452420 [Mizuhopecten yessoensis]
MASNVLPPEVDALEKYLMGKPNFLGKREVKLVWDGLKICVSTRNGNTIEAFGRLENAIEKNYSMKREQLVKDKSYSMLKSSIVAASEAIKNKGGHPQGQSLEAKGKQVTKVQVTKQTNQPLPQKGDDSASIALTRVCQLIEWLHGVLNGRADAKPPDIQKDHQLTEEHTLTYAEAQTQIFAVREKFKELTDNPERNTIVKAEVSSTRPETATTELETPSQQRKIQHERQTQDYEDYDRTHENDRKHYESILQDLKGKYDQHLMKLEDKIQSLNQELHSVKEEKEGLLTRMSKMAGDKLTHNNPAITDLSDPNRPQKLAVKYGELYDNEWTDAIDKMNPKKVEKQDRACIEVLLEMLQFCYRECEMIAAKNLTHLEMVCCSFQTHNTQQGKLPEGSEAIKRNLIDAQHGASVFTRRAAVDIVKASLARHKSLKDKSKLVLPYTEKCIEICWSMVTHHPRLFLLWPDVSKEKQIRFDMFQAYTRSGDTVDYVVWPAMLLYKDGPLLRKGTVQPVAR